MRICTYLDFKIEGGKEVKVTNPTSSTSSLQRPMQMQMRYL